MKKVLLIVVGLLAVAAGGFGIYVYLFGKPNVEVPKIDLGPKTVRVYFINFPPMAVPVYEEGKVVRIIVFEIQLEVGGEDAKDAILKIQPKMHSALIAELYRVVPDAALGWKQVDLKMLKKHLIGACDKVAGRGVVRNILIPSAFDRPL